MKTNSTAIILGSTILRKFSIFFYVLKISSSLFICFLEVLVAESVRVER